MFNPPVKFGTDGWRAVIADGFTFERVARVSQASAKVLAATYPGDGIIVGYDNRFMSEIFARQAAESVAALGLTVKLATVSAPTPAFSWAAKHQGYHGALVITASHNPPQYSGIKVKGGFGGSVTPEVSQQIETEFNQGMFQNSQHPEAYIHDFDPWPTYCEQLKPKVNLEAIQQAKFQIWIDAMYGSAAGGMTRLLGQKVEELRSFRDPLFGGFAPEPLPPQLTNTMKLIQSYPAPLKVGLVFDGDGDRIAAIDGQGQFLSPQILIPILIEHLAKRRGFTGEIVKTVSGSQLFDQLAAFYGIAVTEMPVGFKYIADRMMQTDVLLGGEESGGIGYPNHIPERDAMLSALYLLEAVALTGLDLSELYQNIQTQVGYVSRYHRRDLHLKDQSRQTQLLQQLQVDPPTSILDLKVIQQVTKDGHKFILADNSWLMIRGSGTEPLLRLYCEARDDDAVKARLDWAEQWALS